MDKANNVSDSLFPRFDSLLAWLPGETLFSLCSRLHRLWGHSLSSRSTQIMFGGNRLGMQHDFPSGLEAFANRTEGHLGSAVEICRDRTLLRFYLPFIDQADINYAISTMRGPSVNHLKFRLGLLTSRFRANHPLKACPTCMHEDLIEHGWVYWHVVHQYPGVWICPEHGAPLRASLLKSTGVERFIWTLPVEANLVDPCPIIDINQGKALLRLASLTSDLVESPEGDSWLRADCVQATLRKRFQERGWLTAAGNIRLKAASADYLQHCSKLRFTEELSGLPSSLEEAKAQLGRLIRPLRSGVHPIRLLVSIDWLFSSVDDFRGLHLNVQNEEHIQIDSDTVHLIGRSDNELARRARLHDLMKSGVSARAASKEIGIDVSTAMVWAASEGIRVQRRPKALKPQVRASLIRCLRNGLDKKAAADQQGISIETVTRLLHSEIGLHAAWKSAKTAAAQRMARDAWVKLLQNTPGGGVKMLRAMEPAAYAWLYRNDRTWLTNHTPVKAISLINLRRSPVRWDERDSSLCTEVEVAVERLVKPGRRLKLWEIYQAVPRLKPKLSVLHQLPLTQQAIERALGRRRSKNEMDLLSPKSDQDCDD